MIKLTSEQDRAVNIIESNRLSLFTGPPGSGKTTTLAAWLKNCSLGDVMCFAPTGKAAQRMMEAFLENGIHLSASTIHSALEPLHCGQDGGAWLFDYNRNNRFTCNVAVIDEMSMCDNQLFLWLIESFQPGTKIVMTGDPDQLPPVGKGKPFIDMINSGVIPHARLTEIHRFAGRGAHVCQSIQRGHSPVFSKELNLLPNAGEFGPENIMHLERQSSKASFNTLPILLDKIDLRGYDISSEVQVICSRNSAGPLSRNALNKFLQQLINPDGKKSSSCDLRHGDKVMCLKNGLRHNFQVHDGQAMKSPTSDYVANGESGSVLLITDSVVVVDFGSKKTVGFYIKNIDSNLTLSYAITSHKSQGGGWPVVIYMIDKSKMIDRSLVYTAISRFQHMCFTIGKRSVMDRQIREIHVDRRRTLMERDLRKMVNHGKGV